MISVDTSVVVRYLVGEPAGQALRAERVIDDASELGVSVVVLLETAHLLRTQYGISRTDVLDTLIDLVTRKNVEVLGLPTEATIEALTRARSMPGAPLPDALVAASSRVADALPLYSFDKQLARHGVPVVEP
jgi:predicted nucleic-acid-binding protein